jgi:hypothetical protein
MSVEIKLGTEIKPDRLPVIAEFDNGEISYFVLSYDFNFAKEKFSGIIIKSSSDNKVYEPGSYSSQYTTNSFRVYSGEVTIKCGKY